MHGVVSLLDSTHEARVAALWAELARSHDVRGVYRTPYPHFSYQVAPHYDVSVLEAALARAAAQLPRFTVRTAGLALFTGAQPVLYIPVVRDARLSAVQQRVWDACAPAARDTLAYYAPARWMPHITLALGDVTAETLAPIVRELGARDFDWQIEIDNLAFIHDTGEQQVIAARFALQSCD